LEIIPVKNRFFCFADFYQDIEMKNTIARLTKLIITTLALSGMVSAASLPDTMLTNAWSFSLARLKSTMSAITDTTKFPRSASQTWTTVASSDWTSGFYPGCLWLAYEKSGDTTFRHAAQRWTSALYAQRNDTSTHDVGFEILCSYGNGYRLLGTASYKTVMLTAAQTLTKRYKPLAGIIDCWQFAPYDTGWEEIIDCMMNLEPLFWASQNGGGQNYYDTAVTHATKAMTNHFRADSSTYHVVKYSRITGAMIAQVTNQGYSNSSCWARGQSWAINGFTMAYRFTKNAQFLVAARKAADYFIRRLPVDRIPYWDFQAPGVGGTPDTTPRDASAAAIAASGLLELSTCVGAADSLRYRDSAVSILRGLCATKYRAAAAQASILNYCTGNRPQNTEVNVGLIYADYYFLQALLRYELYSGTTAVSKPNFSYTKPAPAFVRMLPSFTSPVDLLGRKANTFSPGTPSGIYIIRSPDRKSQSFEFRLIIPGFDYQQ
jgi:unsaturated chondroitin disaccharide hydrolase